MDISGAARAPIMTHHTDLHPCMSYNVLFAVPILIVATGSNCVGAAAVVHV